MKLLTQNFPKLLLAGSIVFLSSCDKDDDTTTDPNVNEKDATVKEVLESEERYSRMNEAVEESEQSEFFAQSSTNITLFAANNDAFDELFASMNVSSMSELETKMGDEAFADLILYHAINGRFNVSEIEEGHNETNAENADNARLTVHIQNENNGRLMFNGNDDNGAMSTGSAAIGATNGTIIEIDGVLWAQTNIENIRDAEEQHESYLFMDVLTNAEANTRTQLSNEGNTTTVFVATDAQVEAMLRTYFRSIIDADDLNNLLDANEVSNLLDSLQVSTMAELLTKITVDDLLSISSVTMANIIAELDAEDNTELLNNCIFPGDLNLEDEAANNGSVTSEAGVAFDVSVNAQNKYELRDADGNKIIVDGKSAQSVNGSVYTILNVQQQ